MAITVLKNLISSRARLLSLCVLILLHLVVTAFQILGEKKNVQIIDVPPETTDKLTKNVLINTKGCIDIIPMQYPHKSTANWRLTGEHYVNEPKGLYDQYLTFNPTDNFSFKNLAFKISGSGGAGMYITNKGEENPLIGDLFRLADDGKTLFWGAHDGSTFTGIGYFEIKNKRDDYLIEVIKNDLNSSYTLIFDDIVQLDEIPLKYSYNEFGFTNSMNGNLFKILECDDKILSPKISEIQSAPEQTNINSSFMQPEKSNNLDTLDWFSEGRRVSQNNLKPKDNFFDTGFIASNYELSVEMNNLLNETEQFGPGLVFFANTERILSKAIMLRFQNSGKEIFWGQFDEKNVFEGNGFKDLGSQANTRVMKVKRLGKILTISVDGKEAINLQLSLNENAGGSIGLFTYGGPFIFENLKFDWVM